MRRLQIVPCPVPDALAQANAGDTERWCDHCSRHVGDARELDAEQFDALVRRAADSRVCMQLEVEARRPKLRSGVAANMLVLALGGCATTDALGPAQPRAFVASEPLADGGSRITGFVIGEDGSAMPGALVSLVGEGLSTPVVARADDLGMYGFVEVPPGEYTLVVSSEQGSADTNVSVPRQTHMQVSFRGPYEEESSLLVGYLEVVEVRSGSFEEPGPYLVDG